MENNVRLPSQVERDAKGKEEKKLIFMAIGK